MNSGSAPSQTPSSIWWRVLLFSLASNAAVLLVLQVGMALWPERLPVNSQNIFWLPSGVNTAGLLLLGLRYWPVLLLNAFAPWLLGLDRLDLCLLGSTTNALEALLAALLIQRAGGFTGRFDSLRSVGALVVASLAAPLVNTVIIPAYLCATGMFPWSEYGRAVGNWNLANGTAMLALTALIVSVARRDWSPGARITERAGVAIIAMGLSFVAFNGVFKGTGINLAFVVFPVVIYTAVRFGFGETAVVLGLMFPAIYAAMAGHGPSQPLTEIVATIWFVQAFCWVLAATGLLVAVLSAERRRVEQSFLQASLGEERSRLSALRYQINPHFLFNALNSIRATLPLASHTSREMLTELSEYLRSSLARPDSNVVPLLEEIDSVRHYLAIEKKRFGADLESSLVVDADVQDLNVPVFLLQPLVENAIRHGFESSKGAFRLEVRASRRDALLVINVANKGAWREQGTSSRQGLGLQNIRQRLELLYGGAGRLNVETGGGWVRVSVELPVEKSA